MHSGSTPLRDDWNGVAGYQRFLYAVGAVLLASAAFHLGVLIATGGSWEGPLSWRKPILFGESFGLTALSVGWILGFLPRRPGRGLGRSPHLVCGAACKPPDRPPLDHRVECSP
jgi:predicted cobalt transporter CbtA